MFKPIKDRIEYGGAIMDHNEREAMLKVFDSQGGKRWTIGQESVLFEKELAEKVGVKHAVVVNSGSSALLVAIASLKLPKYSKVIIPALNFPTAFNAIVQNGLVPYVVDIDIDNLLLDMVEVKKAVANEKIDAVIAVNIASNPVDLEVLREIVGPDCKIVLDNCDGLGTLYRGKYVETYADISCVSFHAAHIITMGEGGAILTNDKTLADRSRKLREWGRASGTDTLYKYPGFPPDYRERYVYEEIGWNLKPLELQCAIGRVQLKKLETFRNARIKNFELLYDGLSRIPQLSPVFWNYLATVCWFSFPFLCEDGKREHVMETLERNNIECRTIFSGNILKHPAYQNVGYLSHSEEMPMADKVMFNGVFISVHPSITEEMIKFILKVLEKAV